ncbi:MAG: M50 family metallopeptidase [Deltaproteobacteria bacterium]|nr:M50 family metallopeptidase [Deltaproteobacteria bacterium]
MDSSAPNVDGNDKKAKRAQRALLVAIGVTLALYFLPYGNDIGYPLILFSTFVHEMGHGIAGVLVGGTFEQFQMNSDASGVARVSGDLGRFARAFVSFGGLVGPALMAAFFFVVAKWGRASRITLGVFGLSFLLLDVLLVRNLFGFAFVAVMGVIFCGVAFKARSEIAQSLVVFLGVQLGLTVFSRGDYLFTEYAVVNGNKMPSDVANIASNLFLPYWIWGAFIALFSVAVLGFGIFAFFKRQRTGTNS